MDKKLRCLIVDDEPLALEMLGRYVAKTPFLELVQACSSAVEALEVLQHSDIQFIFLDIQMPDLNGIELSRLLDKDIKVVFTTAFHEYALEGFKVNALDYLLKPFNYEEFLRQQAWPGQQMNYMAAGLNPSAGTFSNSSTVAPAQGSNTLANVAGGALTGASIGNMFSNPWLGAGLGALAGGLL